MKNFGKRIKEARRLQQLSQQQLCEHFYKLDYKKSLSRTAVAQWETGSTKNIEADNLFRVATVLNVDADWILYGNNKNWFNDKKKTKKFIAGFYA